MTKNKMLHKEYSENKGSRMCVNLFYTTPYRDTNKLHTFHKRRRIWIAVADGRKTQTGYRHARQIERFCKLAGMTCKKDLLEVPSV